MSVSLEAREKAALLLLGAHDIPAARAVLAQVLEEMDAFARLAYDLGDDYPSMLGIEVKEEAQQFMLPRTPKPTDDIAIMLAASDPEGCDDDWSYEPQAERFRAELAKRGLKITKE